MTLEYIDYCNIGKVYGSNQRETGLYENLNFESMNLSTFLGLKNPVLNFLNFSSSRVLLSYKPFSYKNKRVFGELS